MPITLAEDDAVTIPPTEEIVANLMWIKTISIRTPSPTAEGQITIGFCPMTSSMQLIERGPNGEDLNKSIHIPVLFQAANDIPSLSTAFDNFIDSVRPLQEWLRNYENSLTNPE